MLVLTVIAVYVLCWLPYWVTQMAVISTPPKQCQSRFALAVFLLADCLSYSNSSMNPVLYAFLSDNFKKRFLKACTCAAGKEVNATLHMENSVFPRRHKQVRVLLTSPRLTVVFDTSLTRLLSTRFCDTSFVELCCLLCSV